MLVRPSRSPGESTLGHVLRVCEKNGLARPAWRLNELGLKAHGHVRICPLCLSVPDALWQASWEATLPGWCPAHGVWLVDICQACGGRLGWRRVRLLQCMCGHALSANKSEAVPCPTKDAIERGLAPPLVLLWLGTLEQHGLQGKPLKKAARQAVRSVAEHLNRGADIATTWPASASALLNRIRITSSGSEQVQLISQAFPGLLQRVGKMHDETWRVKLRHALTSYLVSSLSTNAPLVSRSPQVQAQRNGGTSAALELGISRKHLDRLLEECGVQVPTRRTRSGRRRVVVQEAAMASVRAQHTELLSLKGASKLLGVSAVRMRSLAESDLVPLSGSSFTRAAVHALALALKQGIRSDIGKSEHGVPLSHALRCLVPIERTGEFFRAILDRDIAVAEGHSQLGLRGLVVDAATLRAWMGRPVHARRIFLTLPQAAEELGLKQQVVYGLAMHELLPTETQRVNRRLARVVSLQSLAEFRLSFRTLSAVAREQGWPDKHGLKHAMRSGLDVVTGPTIDGTRQYFVRTSVGITPVAQR